MKIIDAHVHLLERIAGYGRRGALRPVSEGKAEWENGDIVEILNPDYGGCDFRAEKVIQLMDKNNVEKAVIMQGPIYGFQNEYAHESMLQFPGRFAAFCGIDPYCFGALDILKHYIEDYHFTGLKLEMSFSNGFSGFHPEFSLNSEIMDKFWKYAMECCFPVCLDMGPYGFHSYQPENVVLIAKKYPEIPIVIEHCFFPGRNEDNVLENSLQMISEFSNINVTLAALPALSAPELYPFPSVCRYMLMMKKYLGTERIIWGTDIPSVLVKNNYSQLINFVADSQCFAADELRKIMYENAARIYAL